MFPRQRVFLSKNVNNASLSNRVHHRQARGQVLGFRGDKMQLFLFLLYVENKIF